MPFTPEEDHRWARLYARQMEIIQDRACSEYIKGLELLSMATTKVPMPGEVSASLKKCTGWIAEPVPAVIGPTAFFYSPCE